MFKLYSSLPFSIFYIFPIPKYIFPFVIPFMQQSKIDPRWLAPLPDLGGVCCSGFAGSWRLLSKFPFHGATPGDVSGTRSLIVCKNVNMHVKHDCNNVFACQHVSMSTCLSPTCMLAAAISVCMLAISKNFWRSSTCLQSVLCCMLARACWYATAWPQKFVILCLGFPLYMLFSRSVRVAINIL